MFVRPVEEDHLEIQAGNDDPADRGACGQCASVPGGLSGDQQPFLPWRGRAREDRGAVCPGLPFVLARKHVLLVLRVERRERVLPEPDDDDPDECKDARDEEHRPDRAAKPMRLLRRRERRDVCGAARDPGHCVSQH